MSNENDKTLRLVPGGGKPDQTKQAIRQLRENMDDLVELQSALAQIQRAKFKALIAEGFTEAQALELAKNAFS
tara:strand:+ start:295 stop:513 length:219 start_codon:yes stop_codon:yes gene_type:complete